ncbi:hypothetical protein N665_0093s0038 [Sinapis alba]|nr:hypothetical protein N665_0093s0038 [Sinapis alba]
MIPNLSTYMNLKIISHYKPCPYAVKKKKKQKLGLSSNTKIHCLNPWQRSKVDTIFRTTRPAKFNQMVKHTKPILPPNNIYRSTLT